jgi:CO/xanthine dehydrogenase FAD-binding subunit
VTEAAEAAREGIEPFDDAYASAWYRTRVLPVHVRRALLGDD